VPVCANQSIVCKNQIVHLNFATKEVFMDTMTLEQFYEHTAGLIPDNIHKEIGHFNVFDMSAYGPKNQQKMPYNRRTYYKISLIKGRNRAEYADKVVQIEKNALLFATPKIPYNYYPEDGEQSGFFCIFTDSFLTKNNSGINLEELPVYQPGGYPIFELDDAAFDKLAPIFGKMFTEMSSNYAYKYDLLRNYVLELIHNGQKLQPATALYPSHSAATRVASLFVELLERQFPIESNMQQLQLRAAKDYAERLAIHVNHLNKVLKETTGQTTTELIASRVVQEAKVLLKQTDWNISEIAYSLGFEQLAHFSNFFRKQTTLSPGAFREALA
jgi:AraC family transcriptional regulator, transcriptional activator of pobA